MKRILGLLIVLTLLTGCTTNKSSEPKTVTFGRYQQHAIDWYVLKHDHDRILLLSQHALDAQPFGKTTWDKSRLRIWLNDYFFKKAFTGRQRKEIVSSPLSNADDLNYKTAVGKKTRDHVFLLSASEAKKYLSTKEKIASPTDYAKAQGAYTNENGDCAWWLRSPGMRNDGPAYYSSQGEIGTRAHQGSENIIGVRPALWVERDAIR